MKNHKPIEFEAFVFDDPIYCRDYRNKCRYYHGNIHCELFEEALFLDGESHDSLPFKCFDCACSYEMSIKH